MGQSVIDFINAEYRTNVKRHIEQAQPLVDFLKRSIDAKYIQEEKDKVRGQQEADYGGKYHLRTGKTLEFKEGISPGVTYEGKLAEWERTQEPLKTREDIINEAQKEYYPEIQEIGELEEGKDPEAWFGQLKAKREAKSKAEKEKIVTKWRDKLVGMGGLDYAKKIKADITEEEAQSIVSKISAKQREFELIPYGKDKASLQKLSAEEQFKVAVETVGGRSEEQINSEIETKKSELGIEEKKKGPTLFGIFPEKKGKYDKEKVELITSDIEDLETAKEYEKYLRGIFSDLKPGEVKPGETKPTEIDDSAVITYGEWKGTVAQFKARMKEAYPNRTDEEINQAVLRLMK